MTNRYQTREVIIVDTTNWIIKYAHLFIADLSFPMRYTGYFSISGETGNLIFTVSTLAGDHQMFICDVIIYLAFSARDIENMYYVREFLIIGKLSDKIRRIF